MRNVAVVTDSVSSIPKELADSVNITVIPLYVAFSGRSYREGIDLNMDDFYRLLEQEEKLPTTSQPNVEDFEETYKQIQEQDYAGIISIHVSGALSGTIDSAKQAAKAIGNFPIHIVDSCNVGMAQGFVALEAAREALRGASIERVAFRAQEMVAKVRLFTILDTLQYLQRGGRIGKVAAFAGSLFNIKPIISVKNELFSPARVRSLRKGFDLVKRWISQEMAPGKKLHLSVGKGTNLETARNLLEEFQKIFQPVESILYDITPVIGTHSGPGVIGVTYFVE